MHIQPEGKLHIRVIKLRHASHIQVEGVESRVQAERGFRGK